MYTAKKRKFSYVPLPPTYSPEQEASPSLVIEDSDAPTEADEEQTPDIAAFLAAIKTDQEECTLQTAGPIKDTLVVGSAYRVLTIKDYKTRFGQKQVWVVEDVNSGAVERIWASKTLTKYVGTGGKIDPIKVRCMKMLTIQYGGYEACPDGKPIKYLFDFTD